MEIFRAFSGLHAAALGAIAALTLLAILRARRGGARTPAASPTERAIGLAYVAAWIGTYGWFLFSPLHDPLKTYPLQMCHLTALAAGLLLVTGWRPLRAIVYFWGIALCTQALVTPSLTEGPAIYPFWFFWTSHGLIVGVAAYDVCARGFRPALRDYGTACAAGALYVAAVLPLDLWLGANYGFVGPSRPEVPTIVDFLGPWPERVGVIMAIVAAAMGLALAPWELLRQLKTERADDQPG